jgi:hypothetical protein
MYRTWLRSFCLGVPGCEWGTNDKWSTSVASIDLPIVMVDCGESFGGDVVCRQVAEYMIDKDIDTEFGPA